MTRICNDIHPLDANNIKFFIIQWYKRHNKKFKIYNVNKKPIWVAPFVLNLLTEVH